MAADRWAGDEHCGFCLQRYAYELEVFCALCDRPMCPLCVVHEHVEAQRFCPDCATEARRNAGAR